jgi:hypothetical protein
MPSGEAPPAPPPPHAPPPSDAAAAPRASLSCTRFADALYFCYSPVYQVQQLYRRGALDDCSGRWGALYDCMSLKAKPDAELQARPYRAPCLRACGAAHGSARRRRRCDVCGGAGVVRGSVCARDVIPHAPP